MKAAPACRKGWRIAVVIAGAGWLRQDHGRAVASSP